MTITVCLALASGAIGIGSIVGSTRFRRGPLISPFSTSMFVLVSIFGIRPLYMVALDDFDFYGFDVRGGATQAAGVGFLSIAGLALGHSAWVRPSPPEGALSRSTPIVNERSTVSFRACVAIAALMLCAWLVLTVLIGGGPSFIAEIFQGRTARVRTLSAGVPVAVGALSTAASVVLATGRISIERVRRLDVRELWSYWVVGAATFLPPIALGQRRFLLPTLIVLIVAPLMRDWGRRVSTKAVATMILIFFVLVSIPFIRSAGSRPEGAGFGEALVEYLADAGWSGAIENYFVSYDTEMFSYTAYASERLGSEISYGYGDWIVGDALLAPLPSAVTSSLGLTLRSDTILVDAFGTTCAVGACPVPSAVAIAMTDFGPVGVVVVFVLLGAAFRRFEQSLTWLAGGRLVVAVAFVGYAPVLVRGNTINLLWVFSNVAILALFGRWLSVRHSTPSVLKAGRGRIAGGVRRA